VRRLRAFLARLIGAFDRTRQEQDAAEELNAHLEMHVADNLQSGMTAEEARREALHRLGGFAATEERLRDQRRIPVLETALRDLRFAVRALRRAPGFAAITVLTLALGIGANTAIFTIVHAVLIERPPFGDPDRLVVLWEENVRRPGQPNTISPGNCIRWQERATDFESIAAIYDWRANLTGQGEPQELVVQDVTSNFFSTLGVAPFVGRGFASDEGPEGRNRVAVLSYGLWQRRFGGDPGIVGKAIQLNGRPFTVIGVMPSGFGFFLKAGSLVGKPAELWTPFAFTPQMRQPVGRWMSAIARLKAGVGLAAARAQMSAIASGLAAEFPAMDTGWNVRVVPLHEELSGEVRPVLLALLGAVAFVLLIACANVASLLLARGTSRVREMAIRTALGASRSRILIQLLTENLLLALIGGAAGLLAARWGVRVLLAASPADLTGLGQVRLNGPVLAFTAILSILTAAISGLAPALLGSRPDVRESLKEGARAGGTGVRVRLLRKAFVVAQVALAVVLLAGAGLMLKSLQALRGIPPGFHAKGVLTARVSLPRVRYGDGPKVLQFFQQAVARVAVLPGVREAGQISYLPFAGLGAATDYTVYGDPAPAPGQGNVTDVRICDDGYFRTMRIPLLRGRLFTDRELRLKSGVVVINEAMARLSFAGKNPIGRRITVDMKDENTPSEIIGVVGDVRDSDLALEARPTVYWPPPELVMNAMTLTIRTQGDPPAWTAAVERVIRSIDKDQPVSDVRTMERWIAVSLARQRFGSAVLLLFAGLALFLAAIGVYGVMSFVVGQRAAELGIRAALGADDRDIRALILSDGARLLLAGLAIGTPLALFLSRALESLLYKARGGDPLAFGAAIAILGVSSLLASYLPARRAARVAPIETLRSS
jgi:putative ABC transport system permease protein